MGQHLIAPKDMKSSALITHFNNGSESAARELTRRLQRGTLLDHFTSHHAGPIPLGTTIVDLIQYVSLARRLQLFWMEWKQWRLALICIAAVALVRGEKRDARDRIQHIKCCFELAQYARVIALAEKIFKDGIGTADDARIREGIRITEPERIALHDYQYRCRVELGAYAEATKNLKSLIASPRVTPALRMAYQQKHAYYSLMAGEYAEAIAQIDAFIESPGLRPEERLGWMIEKCRAYEFMANRNFVNLHYVNALNFARRHGLPSPSWRPAGYQAA